MDQKKKGKYIGMIGALLVHVAFIVLLIVVGFTLPPEHSEEDGMPVMLGEVPDAAGDIDPSLVKVDVMETPPPADEQSAAEQDIITQEDEETVAIKPKTETKKTELKKPEKTAAEKAEEARKKEEERKEQERKAAEETARRRVSGAFNKGAQLGNRGETQGTGTQGSSTGNASSGALNGTGGYGTFSLGGRSIGEGGLPRPAYNVQDEGKVVVTITVNPAGYVIATSINKQTNTVNPALRKAAEDAAKKARFNTVTGMNNQMGTITYYFKLR
ncbi:MAG: TonB family protein [Bacteroides sp.]|nr:TonB family protein [Bacteroides sp.]MCI1681616.1 TonB family protein [Bacteroides sp.]